MSGGEPPLPPSRTSYHPWHARPPHRRRPPPPNLPTSSSRAPWIPRRPRSPPPLAFRARRLPPYKHRHPPSQTSPSASSQPQSLSNFHSHSHHAPAIPRNLQPRLHSPPRTPPRRSDQHSSFRSDHNSLHRLDHFDPPFRSFDPVAPRAPLSSKSRTEPSSFRTDHRPTSDHHSSYRNDPSSSFRTELPAHRDDYDRRNDPLSVRNDSSQYPQRIRPLHGKIHKPRKPRLRRPPSHFIPPGRPSQSHPPSSDSHIFSRVGERSVDSFRAEGRPYSSPSADRRPGRITPPPPPPPPPPVRTNSDEPSRPRKPVQQATSGSDGEPSASRSQSRPLLVQPPPTSGGNTHLPTDRMSPPVSSGDKPAMNGTLRETVSLSPMDASAPNGVGHQSISRNMDLGELAPKCNGNVSPLLNGIVSKSAPPPLDDVKLGSTRETVKRKDKLGLKLGSLGLALTSQALVEQQSCAAASLEPGSIMASGVSRKDDLVHKVLGSKTVPLPASSDDKLAIGARGKVQMSVAAKPMSPRTKSEPFVGEKAMDKEATHDKQELSPHKEPANQSEQSTLPTAAESDAAAKHPTTMTRREDAHVRGAKKEDTLSSANENQLLAKTSFDVLPVIPCFSTASPSFSMMRSSPRVRRRPSVNDKLASIKTFAKDAPSLSLPLPSTPSSAPGTSDSSRELTAQIHEVEARIIWIEREIGNIRNKMAKSRANARSPKKKKSDLKMMNVSGDSDSKRRYAALARKILESAEQKPILRRSHPSPAPMHAAFRLLLTHNRAKAAAAQAECREICYDTEVGLAPISSSSNLVLSKVSEEVLRKVAHELKRRRHAALERRRRLAREYSVSRETWLRRLKSARDKRSKEKREAIRDRDRFLLLSTKGSSALLTQRTSSGRTSTKLFPSISPNGQMNGMSGLDAQLAEIEAAGGTPGFNAIWSKTLARIPDQDLTKTPIPCTSVLIEDPLTDFFASRAVNPWRFEEKLIFMDKFLAYPKNFRKISSFLIHKSSRDCSYFYYTNKLNLGLKQLVKEYQSMKRKGTLRQHVIQAAMKRTTNTVQIDKEPTREEADSILSRAGVSADDFGINDGSGQIHPWLSDLSVVVMKRSERIMIDLGLVDLEGIGRKAFARALSVHGLDWKAISMQMRVQGKTSTHYREFFRQNRKTLENEALMLFRAEKLPMSMRRSQGARSSSPRMSPRSSPRSSPKSSSTSNEKLKLLLPSGVAVPNGSILSKTNKRRDLGGAGWEGKKSVSVREKDNGKSEKESKNHRFANAQ